MGDALRIFLDGGCVEMSDDPRRNQIQIEIVEAIVWSDEVREVVQLLAEFFGGET